MNLQNNPLKWVLPLQHVAKVKTVEMLWRNSVNRHELKDSHANSQFNFFHYQLMSQYLEKDVDKLLVPEAMKDELKVFVMEMVAHGISWLNIIVDGQRAVHQQDKNEADMLFCYLVDNFCWDNSGQVDGSTMLRSYVKNKKTIDFYTWKLLCDYCIEDGIVRFSKTIDWKNCKSVKMTFIQCIYWYRKIYGKLPTKKMWYYSSDYLTFKQSCCKGGQFDENKFIQTILLYNVNSIVAPGGTVTIKYFRNQPKHEVQLDEILLSGWAFFYKTDIFVYLLRDRGINKAWLEHIYASHKLFDFLVQWPWHVFTDNWLDILADENVPALHFLRIFGSMSSRIFLWKEYGLMENQRKLLCERIVYQPFRAIWALFKRKFGVGSDSTREICEEIYESNDITFCKILFDEVEPSQRKYLLEILGDCTREEIISQLRDDDFCTEFLEEVLKTDGERKIFREIVNSRRSLEDDKTPPSSSRGCLQLTFNQNL